VNEVFLACMFAGNTAVLLVAVVKVRAWRKWIREYARECREAAHGAKGAYNAARAEANFCENTAGRCRQMEISAQHAAQRAERATGTEPSLVPMCAPAPPPNPAGLRLYGSDDSDFRGTD
jgi:hypothetical protein